MSALLVEEVVSSPRVRLRMVPDVDGSGLIGAASLGLGSSSADRGESGARHLVLTRRGFAVVVSLFVGVFLMASVALVSSFLSVSNEAPTSSAAAAAVAAVP
jgi:hypothetical protein